MIQIRKYQERDYHKVRSICKETADKNFQTEVICWMFLDYFLTSEPEHVFVAEDKEVIGYIVVSLNYELYHQQMKEEWIPKIKKYNYFYGLFLKLCLKMSYPLDEKYGGSFHMNITPSYQHQGIGISLLDAAKKHVHAYQKKYLYCINKNKKTRSYGFYQHYGFKPIKSYFGGAKALLYKINLK